MRFLAATLLAGIVVCASSLAHGRCAASGMWLAAREAKIPTNGRIVLNAFATSQKVFDDVAKKRPRLTRAGTSVPLHLVDLRSGEVNLRQAIFEPATLLKADATYSVEIDGAGNELREVVVHTSSTRDSAAPVWKAAPSVAKPSRVEMGCGPSVTVDTIVNVEESGAFFVDVEARRRSDGKVVRFLVPVEEKIARIGRGMCSGAFFFEPSEAYELTLTAVDGAGQSAPAPGASLRIVGPAGR